MIFHIKVDGTLGRKAYYVEGEEQACTVQVLHEYETLGGEVDNYSATRSYHTWTFLKWLFDRESPTTMLEGKEDQTSIGTVRPKTAMEHAIEFL
mgnify:CR=1 FL=1